jgi:hypothetical protein
MDRISLRFRQAQFSSPPLTFHQIILPSGPLSISKSAKRIFAIIAKYKELFLYGGRVVEMSKSNENKMPVLSPLDCQAFRSRIEHYGPVMAWRVGSHGEWLLKPNATCSMDTALALLGHAGKKPFAANRSHSQLSDLHKRRHSWTRLSFGLWRSPYQRRHTTARNEAQAGGRNLVGNRL